jgi:hypothetical protein
MEFATNLGQWREETYTAGSVVIGPQDDRREHPPHFRGVSSWSDLDGVPFWCYGSGRCGHCQEQVWARIEARANKIARIEPLFERPEANFSDFLATWGRL